MSTIKGSTHKGSVKFDGSKYVKHGVTIDDVEEIKLSFDLFDTDLSGAIDVKQLKAAMTSLGFESKNRVIYQMVSDLDSDGNNEIDFDEFIHLITNRVNERDTKANFDRIFNLFDDEKTGYISTKNLMRVAKQLNIEIQEPQLEEMIDRADLDSDGLVSPQEFFNVLTRKIHD